MSNVLLEHAIFISFICWPSFEDKWMSCLALALVILSRGHFRWSFFFCFFCFLSRDFAKRFHFYSSENMRWTWPPFIVRQTLSKAQPHSVTLELHMHSCECGWLRVLSPTSIIMDDKNSAAAPALCDDGILKTICALPFFVFVFVLLNFIHLD